MNTTRTKRAVWPLALVSAAFLLGCQEQASSPTGPEGSGPLFTHKNPDKPHGGPKGGRDDEDPTEPVTWSEAELSTHGAPIADNTLQSSCPGFPGAQSSKPSVEWKNGAGNPPPTNEGCVTVTPFRKDNGDLVDLTNDASLIVTTKKGNTNVTVQFSIQDKVGPEGIQYRTDSFKIDLGPSGFTGFKGAGSTLHIHSTVEIWRLKGHTGGPKEEMVGTINIGDIVYN